ncbi:DUF7125 family protein [Geoglobus acetivorans]
MKILSTGITLLDKRLGGGVPAGSMVCVYANPISMPEAFLYQFASSTVSYYFTTSRLPKFILEDMESLALEVGNVNFIDVYSRYYLSDTGGFIVEDQYRDRDIFDFIDEKLSSIDTDECAIIFDNLSFFLNLHVPPGLKEWLVNKIYHTTKNLNAVAYCYMIKGSHPKEIENMVINLSDVVFDIDSEKAGDKMVNRLGIPKMRKMKPIDETFRYYISEGVQIDTSKDIA